MCDAFQNPTFLSNVRASPALGLGACLLLAAGTYATGLWIPYYGDDFLFYFPALGLDGFDPFVRTSEVGLFYRPLQDVILLNVQQVVGLNPVPVHVLQIGLHLALVGLVYEGSRRCGGRTDEALGAALVMAISQANVAAVLGNDTLSQVGGALFGYLALRLYTENLVRTRTSSWLYAGAAAMLVTALLFKETSAAFLVLIGGAELAWVIVRIRRGRKWTCVFHAAKRYVPVVLLFLGYLLLRDAAGARQAAWGDEAYAFRVGFNVVRNAGLFGIAALTPVSTPAIVEALSSLPTSSLQSLLVLGGAIAGSAATVGLVVWGWAQREEWTTGAAAVGIAAASLIPLYLLNDVSELYVYNAMPALAVVLGVGGASALRTVRAHARAPSLLVVGAAVLIASSHAVSVVDKAGRMDATGVRTHRMLDALTDVLAQHPGVTHVCLTSRAPEGPAYSVYEMPGVTPLAFAGPYLAATTERDRLRISVPVRERPGCDASAALRLAWTGREFVPVEAGRE